MYQPQLARCPYCQQPTLANGYFCAFCGRQLAQFPPQQRPPPPQRAPPPQAYPPQSRPQQSYGQPYPGPAAGPGGAPPLICAYCGVANDPWLNHCKVCQRPLGSTG